MSLGLFVACGDDEDAGSGTGEGSSSGASTTTTTDASTTSGTTTDASTTSTSGDPQTTGGSTSGTTGGQEGGIGDCFVDEFVGPAPLPNYDQFGVVYGEHCQGSNHQDIMQVDRVVFIGDSVTVGTPPSPVDDYYRSRLAESLADRFGLSTGGSFGLWKTPNAIEGTSLVQNSGDFWSCSKWGARNDDLAQQIEDCFPPELDNSRTLVVMTMGGNDLQRWAKDYADGVPIADIWMEAEQMVAYKREAIETLVDTERFPNGNMVVFANVYEFTDATGDLMSCDLSGLVGFDQPIATPEALLIIVAWIQEQYAKIAAETQTDFVFMFEAFCGHGFASDDPEAPCYRGPGNENWFDLTCIHPTPTGHGVISDMFLAVIDE